MPALLFLLIVFLAAPVQAQAIQRCERDGQVSYTDGACPPESTQRSLRPPPVDAEAQRTAQAKLAQQIKQRAQQEQKDDRQAAQRARQEQSRKQKDAQAAARQRQKCQASEQRLQWLKEDLAHAIGNARAKQEIRLRRAEQLHALTCARRVG